MFCKPTAMLRVFFKKYDFVYIFKKPECLTDIQWYWVDQISKFNEAF